MIGTIVLMQGQEEKEDTHGHRLQAPIIRMIGIIILMQERREKEGTHGHRLQAHIIRMIGIITLMQGRREKEDKAEFRDNSTLRLPKLRKF